MTFRADREAGPAPGETADAESTDDCTGPASEPAYRITTRQGAGRRGLACWLALPREIAPGAVPLVAVHGIRRQPEAQVRAFARRAAVQGRPVIAPLFGEERWRRYQQVVRGGRADLALLDLMEELRLAGIWRSRRFAMAGYSGGAQFAHRFAMLYPHLVERLTVTAAGWYTFPEDAPFPYGIGATQGRDRQWGPRFAEALHGFLSIPVEVCIGSADDMPDDNTRHRPGLDSRQGTDRLTRATRWVAALHAAAEGRGLPARARLHLLEGCGHDFEQCVARGLPRIALPGPAAWRQSPAGAAA